MLHLLSLINLFFTISYDQQIFFQTPQNVIMECIITLHNDLFFLIIFILFFVLWILYRVIIHYKVFNGLVFPSKSSRIIITCCWKIVCFLNNLRWLIHLGFKYRDVSGINTPEVASGWLRCSRQNAANRRFLALHLYSYDDKNSIVRLSFTHHTLLEQIWSIIPTLILGSILLPSMTLIYMLDNVFDNTPERSALVTLKIIGNQWYWTYQTTNGCWSEAIIFDSYLDNNLGYLSHYKARPLRLLQVDKEVYLPVNTKVRLLITSNDVIHSWAIPSCGVKMDAVPGRINSTGLEINSFGRKIGQCSELCGTGHAFMPIVIRVVPLSDFILLGSEIFYFYCS